MGGGDGGEGGFSFLHVLICGKGREYRRRREKEKREKGKREGNYRQMTYISAQYQVIDDAHDLPHGGIEATAAALRVREVDVLTIAQQAPGQ